MSSDDQTFAKWRAWLRTIRKEVSDLVIGRHVFWEVQKIIRENSTLQKPSTFYTWMGSAYAAWGPIGVRRQLDLDRRNRSLSLTRLLEEVRQNTRIISRQRFVDIYARKLMGPGAQEDSHSDQTGSRERGAYALSRVEAAEIASSCFDKYAGAGSTHLSTDQVERDLCELSSKTEKVRAFADKKIAHLDQKPPTELPTFDELDECIAFLEHLVLKYEMLFEASAPPTLLPTWQYDWKAIFYQPWIPRASRENTEGTRGE